MHFLNNFSTYHQIEIELGLSFQIIVCNSLMEKKLFCHMQVSHFYRDLRNDTGFKLEKCEHPV